MKVYKFGGASVNSAEAIENMASIVRDSLDDALVIVVSAMGKTTNLLEQVVPGVGTEEERAKHLARVRQYHTDITLKLFSDKRHPIFRRLEQLFEEFGHQIGQKPTHYNFDYDQTVSYGEILSTTIISHYLNHIGLKNEWVDIRDAIITDNNYREGHIDWDSTQRHSEILKPTEQRPIIVTQGFIAGTKDGYTTTLGREGSDYSASIISYCLHAEKMIIWKDVPGFLNADPKFFQDTIKIRQIPYNEAIELAYYGASVIHPKTVKPIQNRKIALHIKSFLAPGEAGSVIGPYETIEPLTPLYIFKNNQILISILPKDFSFIAEDNLTTIFASLSELNIRVNLMQNSALSFSICIDNNDILVKQLTKKLGNMFYIRYNEGLQLITIRYYTQAIIDSIVAQRPILLQQRSRTTTQIICPQS